jgi:hypothetical protein
MWAEALTMAGITTSEALGAAGPPPSLELHNGDRMSREEFHRRYLAMRHVKKAELIEGVVHMSSPVRHKQHGKPHGRMITWLGMYAAHTPGVEGGANSSLLLDDKNELQPDSLLMISPDCGGQVRLDERGYLVTAPELVGEVSVSSVSYDLHDKLIVYKRHQVREYIVWRVADRAVDWFVLPDRHDPLQPDERGILKSIVFPGLWLDVQALLADDMRRVLSVLHEGIGTPEHQGFVRRLGAR